VRVLAHRIEEKLAVAAPDGHDAYLPREGDELFKNAGRAAGPKPRIFDLPFGFYDGLPLPVIPQRARFEHRRQTDLLCGAPQVFYAVNREKFGRRDAEIDEEALLGESVARDRERVRGRVDKDPLRQIPDALGRDVLKLVGDDVDRSGEPFQRFEVAVVTGDMFGHRRGAGVGGGVQRDKAQTERDAGESDHAGELPRAENADCLYSGRHRQPLGSGLFSTLSVCLFL